MGDLVHLRLAHSPDSDDLVMWWPLVGMGGSGPRVGVGRLRFELVARDVEELNKMVVGDGGGGAGNLAASPRRRAGSPPLQERREGGYDVTAISCAAYAGVAGAWAITRCGGSFGEGYGPCVVVRDDSPVRAKGALRGKRIGVPGVNTSAFLALSLMLGSGGVARAFEPVEMLFSEIPGAVARGEVDAGVLIHEAQLTFAAMGLREVVNLGAWWGTTTDLPLPLGLNVVRRDLDERHGAGTVAEVGRVLAASVRYAVDHAAESRAYLRANRGDRAEWDDDALLEEYLRRYVSGLSVDMGERGAAAIGEFLGRGAAAGLCAAIGRVDLA